MRYLYSSIPRIILTILCFNVKRLSSLSRQNENWNERSYAMKLWVVFWFWPGVEGWHDLCFCVRSNLHQQKGQSVEEMLLVSKPWYLHLYLTTRLLLVKWFDIMTIIKTLQKGAKQGWSHFTLEKWDYLDNIAYSLFL